MSHPHRIHNHLLPLLATPRAWPLLTNEGQLLRCPHGTTESKAQYYEQELKAETARKAELQAKYDLLYKSNAELSTAHGVLASEKEAADAHKKKKKKGSNKLKLKEKRAKTAAAKAEVCGWNVLCWRSGARPRAVHILHFCSAAVTPHTRATRAPERTGHASVPSKAPKGRRKRRR